MSPRRLGLRKTACIALVIASALGLAADKPAETKEALHLTVGQKEFLPLEPILVTVRVESERIYGLPAEPGPSKLGALRFEVEPAVKPRPGAKPLPLEGQDPGTNAQARDHDLFEWFLFPEKGTWTVRAVFEHKGATLTSEPITLTIRKPAQGDPELGPVARIHHPPWSQYETNAFCGDTFDLVKSWPESRLAKYCHYWNGRHLQNKKEYEKAMASYRTVVEKYPDFALADDAEYGIIECLYAQKKLPEAQKLTTALRQKLNEGATKAGIRPSTGQTIVQRLSHGMTHRINRDLGLE